jgi:hypothetical protein
VLSTVEVEGLVQMNECTRDRKVQMQLAPGPWARALWSGSYISTEGVRVGSHQQLVIAAPRLGTVRIRQSEEEGVVLRSVSDPDSIGEGGCRRHR